MALLFIFDLLIFIAKERPNMNKKNNYLLLYKIQNKKAFILPITTSYTYVDADTYECQNCSF